MEMLLSSELSFWLVIPSLGWRWSRGARGRVFCVVCWPLRALWATSTCSATSWSAATTNHDVIATIDLLQSLVVCYLPQQFVSVPENNSSFELRLSSITVALYGAHSQSMCFLCEQCNRSQEMQQRLFKKDGQVSLKRRQKESFPDSCAWSRSLMTKASSPQEWTK